MEKTVELGTLISPAKTVRCGNGNYPVLSMTMHNGLVFQDEKFKKAIASKDTSDYKVVYRNQLVISFPIDEGVLAAQRIVDAGIVSPAYGVWDIDQTQVLPEYLEYALRCDRAIQYYKAKLRGSTARRRSLPTPTLLAFTIPLPAIEEQESILDRLHAAKTIIEKRETQIRTLSNLIKARFVEMFGDYHTNSKGFESHKGSELFKFASGKFLPEEKRLDVGVPVYGGNGIAWYTDEPMIDYPTIIIGRVGALCGNIHTVREPVWITDNAIYIKENKTEKFTIEFLTEMMTIMDFYQYADFSGQPKITQKPLESLHYLTPPIEMQNDFTAFCKQVDKSKVVVQKALDEAQLLFDSLMQEYFG